MTSRDDRPSWLDGQAPATAGAGRGARLGLPASGSGSLGRLGPRLAALAVDWLACMAIAAAFFPVDPDAWFLARGGAWAPLVVFAVENVVLVGTLGHTLGHRLLGLRVRRATPSVASVDRAPGLVAAAVRTGLLCVVIPAVVWDADGRGLHDKAAGTVLVRR